MGSEASALPVIKHCMEQEGVERLIAPFEKLRRNPRATETLVQDLNASPHLPFAEARFDAVIYIREGVSFVDEQRLGPFPCSRLTGSRKTDGQRRK